MSRATRQTNRAARRIIKFTKREWNPAQEAEWAGRGDAAVWMTRVNALRFQMCLQFVQEGGDGWRLRSTLRAVEVKG